MKNFTAKALGIASRLAILAFIFGAFVWTPTLSSAHMPETSINVANNSSRTIKHLYLSSTQRENWSDDQLADNALNNGDTFTLNAASCYEANMKVIAEDQDGCFSSTVVSCSESSTWTVTDADARDCGN